MVELNLDPIQLDLFNDNSRIVLRVNSELGIFTLTENEDLLAEEETSYFNLYREECIIDRCRLTKEEKQTVMYFLFAEKLIQLLSSGSNSCKDLAMRELVFNNLLVEDTLMKFYGRLTGENVGEVKQSVMSSLESAKHFEVTPSAGGLLNGVEEMYLSTGHTLVTSLHGMAILQDKEFVDLRLFDTGDMRWAPINFYSKLAKLAVSNPTSVSPIRVKILQVLKLYTLGSMISKLGIDEECKDTLTAQLVNIYWRLKRG